MKITLTNTEQATTVQKAQQGASEPAGDDPDDIELPTSFQGTDDIPWDPQQAPCNTCLWRFTDGSGGCEAFPKGIPAMFLMGYDDHTTSTGNMGDPEMDDGGVTYTPIPIRQVQVQLTAKDDLTNAQTCVQSSTSEGFAGVLKSNMNHDKAGRFASSSSSGGEAKPEGEWKKLGKNLGSNPGGVYEKDGKKHYVKFPFNKGQIYAEQAADKVYELMGVASLKHKATDVGGKTASVTEWQDVKELGSRGWENMSPKHVQQAANAFVASALVKNWDVVGLTYDNMAKNAKDDLTILDTGGSFKHRAMGEPKPYDADPKPEIEGMLSRAKTSGRVFGPLMKSNPEAFTKAAEKLRDIPDGDLKKIATDMRDKTLGDTMVARKKAILDHFKVS